MNTSLCSLALILTSVPAAADIAWQSSYEKAIAAAKAEHKVVFVAVNMDGEGANDRMAKNVYADKGVVALAALTVNVVASAAAHGAPDKGCTRFAGTSCVDHQACDKAVRASVLKPDPSGNVVAPQHVFLDGEGHPLLSVPYEITAGELEWCLVTAIKKVDPASKVAMPSEAHMPRQVVIGAVYDPTGGVGGAIQPLSKADLVALIKAVRRGLAFEERQAAFWRILHSDLPEALDFIQAELRSGELSSGAGGGNPGGGGGGGDSASGDGGGEKHARILHAMGAVSPTVYWELAASFLDASDDILRIEAAVALEQMVAPQAVKALEKALAKEKKPEVAKDMVRALAACGATDPKIQASTMKRARTEKNELIRISSILALGLLEQDASVRACLAETLSGKEDKFRVAAILAAALTREEAWIAQIEPIKAATKDVAVLDAATRALEILHGGTLKRLETPVWTICKDKVLREKTFGKATP